MKSHFGMSFSRKFAVYFQNTLGGYFCIGFEINRPWITKVLSIKEQSSSGFLRKSYYSRSSHRRCFVRKGVLRNLAKSTGKPLRQSLFLNKVAGRKFFFIKKETLAQVFSCGYCEISKSTFLTEHLWMTASVMKNFVRLVGTHL